MNSSATDDEIRSPEEIEEIDSQRKRSRIIEGSSKKGWSLMDRRTDQEVLQEMGVSLLEPDDNDLHCDNSIQSNHPKSLKRKRNNENVNPNANCVTSPYSPKSPRNKICSPSPGPSRVKSPRSAEKARPLQPTEQNLLETTLTEDYLVDEETPLSQVNAYMPLAQISERRNCLTSLGVQEELVIVKRLKSEPQGEDSFSTLSDEMILSVFRWLPKRTLANCMLVCKRWQRLARDETLWQRLDLGNKTLNKDALGKILDRKPVIIRLANSEIGEWHPTSLPAPSRVQYLDLSVCTVDCDTLNNLLETCPGLKKLSLESVLLDDRTCQLIGKCTNLETLNLSMAQGITTEGLTFILQGCISLISLNISWCNLSESALEVLVTTLPQKLQRLNVGGARIMTNDMVQKLVERCPRLVELDVSDCSKLSGPAVLGLQALSRLEHLALSRCYLLPPHVLTKLNSMVSLQYLEVWGMLQSASLNALRSTLPAIQINQFMFSAIARPTVGTRRTSIWGLRTRD